MERPGGQEPDVLSTRLNDRHHSGAPVFTSRLAQRKSFAPRHEFKENMQEHHQQHPASRLPVPSKSPSPEPPRSSSAHSATRIPRPTPLQQQQQQQASRASPNARRPLSFTEAYRMAEEEEQEAMRGSPSPAPRSWRHPRAGGDEHNSSNEQRMRALLNQAPLTLGRRHSSRHSSSGSRGAAADDDDARSSAGSVGSRASDLSDEAVERRMRQYELDRLRMEGVRGQQQQQQQHNGGLARNSPGRALTERERPLERTTSNGGLEVPASSSHRPRSWGQEGKVDSKWLRRAISSPGQSQGSENVVPDGRFGYRPRSPAVNATADKAPTTLRPATVPPRPFSPSKSFAWQADADFTAGDLQVSESPRVTTSRGYASRQRNTKLDEIRQLEIEAELKFPSEDDSVEVQPQLHPETHHREKQASPASRIAKRTNTKLDEIRAREIESLSRRALATARLDEIREKNSNFRSPSPEVERKPPAEPEREPNPGGRSKGEEESQERSVLEEEGEQIPNTPITIFRTMKNNKSHGADAEPSREDSSERENKAPEEERRRSSSHSREDSRDVLRRLSKAASSSPLPDEPAPRERERGKGKAMPESVKDTVKDNERKAASRKEKPSASSPADNEDPPKASVGFADELKRVPSVESASTKRSSKVYSDVDPIDRIEGEAKLFAPLDNYSEKGSTRAPSPGPNGDEDDDDDDGGANAMDETPKAKRPDPQTMPTPKVTGAYVETPVTVKVDKTWDEPAEGSKPDLTKPIPSVAVASFLRERPTRSRRSDNSRSEPVNGGNGSSNRGEAGRSSSVSSSARRSRSIPRSKSPLINSAKPPSVRDDLMEIHRQNQIDDSTLDDFAELMASANLQIPADVALRALEADVDDDDNDDSDEQQEKKEKQKQKAAAQTITTKRETELETFDRMNSRLQSGLLGIQTAKRGIERLEDQVSHAQVQTPAVAAGEKAKLKAEDECHICTTTAATAAASPQQAPATYLHLRLPTLYRRNPLRLTLLGLAALLLALWLAAESAACARYCRPEYCAPGRDCAWSPDDPSFGAALPVKLDQWVAGGRGRRLAQALAEPAWDLWADARDLLAGVDAAGLDTRGMTPAERRAHRRRLRRKGFVRGWEEPRGPAEREKLEAWRAVGKAARRAREAREAGYEDAMGMGMGSGGGGGGAGQDEERMGGDEKVSPPGWF
ncbi:uncharacterized protein E0L32_003127 [Thyridium curvatum]|uniref:Uncharacterized protein n=1 Tax=Thyridium curvatum TaxID=1093900 RepID=A0A507BFE6_9PEZI|nr:uncharacterized protein E0L32_003127 [Thyridium curvatum]TPX17484.1 hypothetical protein E0L32_003127 [Thyridium curvatum]